MPVTRPIPYTQGVPSGSATVILYDNAAVLANSLLVKELRRVRVVLFTDAAATFLVKWQAPGSATLRTFNGPATPPTGEVVAANVPFERDVLLLPGRTQISVTTGSAPTIFEVAIDGDLEAALVQ